MGWTTLMPEAPSNKQAGSYILSFTSQVLLDTFLHFLSPSSPNPSPNSSLQMELTKQVLLWQATVEISRSRAQWMSALPCVPEWFKRRQRSHFRGEFHTSFPMTKNLSRCISIFSCINIWQCPLKRGHSLEWVHLLTWNCWSNSTCLSNHWDIIKFPPLGVVPFLIHLLTSSQLCQKRMLWNMLSFINLGVGVEMWYLKTLLIYNSL